MSIPWLFAAALAAAPPAPLDLGPLVSRADIRYTDHAPRSEEGLPLGNGRMGFLVWTTPQSLRFQVNRADIYPMSSRTTSFFERHGDYCCGAAFLDVDLGGEVLRPPAFTQQLRVYEGAMAVQGEDVSVRLLAWHAQDVFALEVDDRRTRPAPIQVTLRMLRVAQPYTGDFERLTQERAVMVKTFQHTATSRLHATADTIALTQEFVEGDHFNTSAVAARVIGRDADPQFPHESEVRLSVPAARGRFVVLVASAASFDRQADVRAAASEALDAAAAKGFAELTRDNQAWWRAFWEKGYVDLRSRDGSAEYVADNYHYFLYLMAASSRGKFPAKFNGMLWNTGGDLRAWGSQHWFANLSCYYEALPAANRPELMKPVFDMYGGARESWARAAREQWGSQGIYIPEVAFFDGLAPLPDDIAAEMRELYLLRKPWAERSARFMEFAPSRHPHSSRWNWNQAGRWVDGRWVIQERGAGPFGAVTHILGTTAKIAYLFWRQYEFHQDAEWLRAEAYPMIKGAAEFYRHFPNVRQGEDGRYHIHHVNSNETVWGARDTDEDLAAMRGIFGAAVRAAEILGEDADLRAAWRERLDNLPPLPTTADPEALRPEGYSGPPIFVRGLRPAIQGAGTPDGNSLPAFFFDLCNLESQDRATLAVCNETFAYNMRRGFTKDTPVGVLSKQAIAAATLGRADAVRHMIPNQMRVLRAERSGAYKQGGVLANHLTLREGHHALDAQRLGRAGEALHMALMQSNPPLPGGDPVIRLFPAWPDDWDASFQLLARGAFLVRASSREGRVERVELTSQAGSRARVRNPWRGKVRLTRDGTAAETLEGPLLEFPTRTGERIGLEPVDAAAASS